MVNNNQIHGNLCLGPKKDFENNQRFAYVSQENLYTTMQFDQAISVSISPMILKKTLRLIYYLVRDMITESLSLCKKA